MSTYSEFIERKKRVWTGAGIADVHILPQLFPFQQALTRWALRKGRAAIFADCGLGKTPMQLAWASQVPGRVLILAPLCVAEQTVLEGQKFGVEVVYATSQPESQGARIVITNYERLAAFHPEHFAGVVLDECFAPDTEIDVLNIEGHREKKYIQDIRAGETILNASGIDLVSDVHRREVWSAVRVTVAGHDVTCSYNHPWLTRRGWMLAHCLRPGDEIMATTEAVRVVREPFHAAVCAGGDETILQSILLSEMADVPAGDSGESAQSGRCEEAWCEEVGVVSRGQSDRAQGVGAHPGSQSDQRSISPRENLPHIESDAAQTFRAWGQWSRADRAAAVAAGGTWRPLAGGIQYLTGPAHIGLSYLLQDRHRRTSLTGGYRGGWAFSSCAKGAGREEGCQAAFARVDGLEILESGHPELERWRDRDGHIYFYDLGATRHPSYSVNGCLVHNSSILKAFDGKTRQRLIDTFKATPYRLCCTATPSPNDIAELANHAEFLGLQTRQEFLASWFVHDDQGWRMKGHAVQPFYRWLASWAIAMRKPSDIGYDDTGYELPPLTIADHVVEGGDPGGMLFPELGLKGIQGRQKARRASVEDRCQRVADLASDGQQWVLWCGLNAESDWLADIDGAVNVQGSDSYDVKRRAILGFCAGDVRVLVTKMKIAGFGLNMQHCHQMAFVGIGDSYEQYYQAIRRCWRFGQQHPVDAHIVVSNSERAIVANVRRKQADADEMARQLLVHMRDFERMELAS